MADDTENIFDQYEHEGFDSTIDADTIDTECFDESDTEGDNEKC